MKLEFTQNGQPAIVFTTKERVHKNQRDRHKTCIQDLCQSNGEVGYPFSMKSLQEGRKNRTLCTEGTVGCALLEDQSFTCLVPSLNTRIKV
jgi:hypothetical protein